MKMKKIVFVILMAMICMLIAGCTDVLSPYTVEYEILDDQFPKVKVTVTGPPENLVVSFDDGISERTGMLYKGSMERTGSAYTLVSLNYNSYAYDLTIRKKVKPGEKDGMVLYRERVEFKGGSPEIIETYVAPWPFLTNVRLHNSGDFPVQIDYLMVYTAQEEKKVPGYIKIAPGGYEDCTIIYKRERGVNVRVVAYIDDKPVAEYEGVVG
jgi:hypothetical protein